MLGQALAGQHTPAGYAHTATLAHPGDLRRDHLRLERRRELLCLGEPEPKLSQAGLFIRRVGRQDDGVEQQGGSPGSALHDGSGASGACGRAVPGEMRATQAATLAVRVSMMPVLHS